MYSNINIHADSADIEKVGLSSPMFLGLIRTLSIYNLYNPYYRTVDSAVFSFDQMMSFKISIEIIRTEKSADVYPVVIDIVDYNSEYEMTKEFLLITYFNGVMIYDNKENIIVDMPTEVLESYVPDSELLRYAFKTKN